MAFVEGAEPTTQSDLVPADAILGRVQTNGSLSVGQAFQPDNLDNSHHMNHVRLESLTYGPVPLHLGTDCRRRGSHIFDIDPAPPEA